MKKLLFLLFIIFGLNAEPEQLVVGTASGYAPFVSLNEQGEYEGFDIEIAKQLAERLNRKLVLKDLGSMPSLLMALKQGKVDALIWAISITEDRQKVFDMVYYQGEKVETMPLIFWKTIPEGIEEIGDLKKCPKSLCVEAGSYQEETLKKIPGLELKYLDSVTAVVMEIKMGKSSAAAIDPSLVSRFTAQFPEIQVLNLPLPKSQQSLGNGICLSKTNPELGAQVRSAIEAMTKDGTMIKLEKQWKLK